MPREEGVEYQGEKAAECQGMEGRISRRERSRMPREEGVEYQGEKEVECQGGRRVEYKGENGVEFQGKKG